MFAVAVVPPNPATTPLRRDHGMFVPLGEVGEDLLAKESLVADVVSVTVSGYGHIDETPIEGAPQRQTFSTLTVS